MTSLPATSPSRPQLVARSRLWPAWPTIVAESLASVAEPLATALQPGQPVSPGAVAGALAASLAPPESAAVPPEWLWPVQRGSFRRALVALGRYGGALLADPVGTGKTYVALAVAAAMNGPSPTVCLVPAGLSDQWQRAARRTGVRIVPWSHERASRGALPPHTGRLVIIDESHRLRNPATREHAHVARWLLGRRALLLSATPVVNRLADLAHQLRLAVRDDALAPHGLASFGALLGAGRGHPALGLVVLAAAAAPEARPRAVERTERPAEEAPDDLDALLEQIDRLVLSREAPVAALVRGLLWRAAASSPAALAASLRRYRRLLLHAADAARAGRPQDRRALLQLTGALSDQLLLWELLPPAAETAPVDLALDDLPLLDALITGAVSRLPRDDAKLARLRETLADRRATLVFSVSRSTVRWLRDRLGPRAAWCTGEQAGIGAMRVSRRVVFEWFGADRAARLASSAAGRLAPEHVVTTDVAAEGLDFHGVERVVHYDLPWTPARLDQRSGRALRAGSPHAEIEVIRFEPPQMLERRLRQNEVLARKAGLPAIVGLGDGRPLWRWRVELAGAFASVAAARGVAAVTADPTGLLVGFTVHEWPRGGALSVATHLLWWDESDGWTEEPRTLAHRLELATDGPAAAVDPTVLRLALERIGGAVRERLRAIRRAGWESPLPGPASRALLARLDPLARSAARLRDPSALAQVQQAIAFAAGGHTAGEAIEVARLARLSGTELMAALRRLPPPAVQPSALQAQVTGVILFLGAATFPRCPPSAPCSSISTAP